MTTRRRLPNTIRPPLDELLVALTDEQVYYSGRDRNFRNFDGSPMFELRPGSHGQQLRRVGATSHCIICGMPDVPGVLSFAHIHRRDAFFSPCADERRVFRLCWNHHHGGYDQNWISTLELLEAEEAWISGQRPKPHRRDVTLMARAARGDVDHICAWKEPRETREARFDPRRLDAMVLLPRRRFSW